MATDVGAGVKTKGVLRRLRVKTSRQNMSAMAAAFAESGHGIFTGMSTQPRSQARDPMTLGAPQRRAVARRLLLAVPPPDDLERGPVAR
jgi:hypothetical protein